MTSLESIVLPLEQSRALVEHGIVLDTALRWVTNPYNKEPFVIPVWTPPVDEETVLCPAPVLSELLGAIDPEDPTTAKMIALSHALIALHDEEVSK